MKVYQIAKNTTAAASALGNPALVFDLLASNGALYTNAKTKANAMFVYGLGQVSSGASERFEDRRYITASIGSFRGNYRITEARPATADEIAGFKAEVEAFEIAGALEYKELALAARRSASI